MTMESYDLKKSTEDPYKIDAEERQKMFAILKFIVEKKCVMPKEIRRELFLTLAEIDHFLFQLKKEGLVERQPLSMTVLPYEVRARWAELEAEFGGGYKMFKRLRLIRATDAGKKWVAEYES